jgi:acyl-CoA thioester hydrolase
LTNAGSPNMVRRIMSKPAIEYQDIVRPEWIDSNGHMNLAYYVVVFDLATDALYRALDIGDAYREASGNSCFTAETHTLYEREVHLGDKLSVRTWLLGADTKRRRVAEFPPDKYAALQVATREYAPATPPRGAGRRIALPD